jgi:tetraacyldisaccharide 4'-kinase
MDFRVLTKQMSLYPYQQLYFTTLDYDKLRPVFPEAKGIKGGMEQLEGQHVLLLTGIASPKKMLLDIKREGKPASVTPMVFADHHNFRKKDIRRINETFSTLAQPGIIITTEKDATRLATAEGLSDEVRKRIYALPVRISFMLDGEQTFNERIIGYVRKNSRNSILAKGKDGYKPQNSHRAGNGPRTISFRNN